MKRLIIACFLGVTLVGCLKPLADYSHYKVPPAPDYSRQDNWACLPWVHNATDTVPPNSGLKDNQDSAKVDVFFVYPTIDLRTDQWNADIYDKSLNKLIDKTTIRAQATVFNGSCRIFAPRYRQAVFGAFLDKKDNGKKALALAYSDVKEAFLYYMQHYNNGRPVIIAGHSQGCLHAYHLIREFFDTTALKQKLVCAYLVGYKVNRDSMKMLRPCDSAKATGCYVTWNTIADGMQTSSGAKFFSGVCINPLSWKQDSNYVDAVYNLGSMGYKADGLIMHETGARCTNGVLTVKPANPIKFPSFKGSYHIYDYDLFYMNIRNNVADRVNAYLQLSGK